MFIASQLPTRSVPLPLPANSTSRSWVTFPKSPSLFHHLFYLVFHPSTAKSRKNFVNFLEAAKFDSKLSDVEVKLGESATFKTTVSGSPRPDVTWFDALLSSDWPQLIHS